MEQEISLSLSEKNNNNNNDISLNDNKFILALLHNVVFGRIPKTIDINYIDVFNNDYKDNTTLIFLNEIELARKNMTLDLSSSSSLLSKINSIDLYIPLVYKLYDSIHAQPAVRINKSLNFNWESAYSQVNTKMQRSEIIFDIISCLSTKASLHYRYAMSLLSQTNALDNINNVAKHINQAASILKFLSSDMIPNWKSLKDDCSSKANKSNVIYRHPESYECVCRALMAQYMASAQACSIYKAISKGNSPSSLLSKLCVAVVIDIDRCLRDLSSNEYKHELLPRDLNNSLKFIKFFYLSLCRYYQAEDFYVNNETGKSIACLKDSLKFLEIHKTGDSLPELVGSLSGVKEGVDILKRKVGQRLKQIDDENQIVQLQSIANITSIDFPQSVVVLPLQEYIRPCLSEDNIAINFDKNEPKIKPNDNNIITSIFNSFNLGGKTNKPNNNTDDNKSTKPDAESERQRSDSDVARELQDKFNKGLE